MITFLYRNIFLLIIVIYGKFHLSYGFLKHDISKIFTLKTTILLRKIKEDLNKWNIITFIS